MKDMERLKNALGIDSSIIGATVLYNEINKVQNALWKSLNSGRAMDDNDTDMMSNIIEIQDIWNLLYKVNHLRLDLIVTERICI
jgi:predicted NACHT family NTPase